MGRLGALLLLAGCLGAQTLTTADALDVGLGVGAAAPGFELKDQTGAVRTLSGLMGARGVVVVFFRSADW